jgi:conjugal transfer/type IV secretion protein DotA/TraY
MSIATEQNTPDQLDGMVGLLARIFGDAVLAMTRSGHANTSDLKYSDWILPNLIESFSIFLSILAGVVLSAIIIYHSVLHTKQKVNASSFKWITEPTKIAASIGGLMPTALGFNTIAIICLQCALWGIFGANLIYKNAIKLSLANSLKFDASFFAHEQADLRNFALGFVRNNMCGQVLNTHYNNAYGALADNGQYAYINWSAPRIEVDNNQKSWEVYDLVDNSTARLGNGQSICGSMYVAKFDVNAAQNQFNASNGNAAGSSSAVINNNYRGNNNKIGYGILENEKLQQELNQKLNVIGYNLRNEAVDVWKEQTKLMMVDLNAYIANLPKDNYDEKNKSIDELVNNVGNNADKNLDAIIKNHSAELAKKLAALSDSKNIGSAIQILHKTYTDKMIAGGMLELIGYTQHFSSIRSYILSIISQKYVYSQTPNIDNADKLIANDNIKSVALGVYNTNINKVEYALQRKNNTQSNQQNSISECKQKLDEITPSYADVLNAKNSAGQQSQGQAQNQAQNQEKINQILSGILRTGMAVVYGSQEIVCGKLSTQSIESKYSHNETLDRIQKGGEILSILSGQLATWQNKVNAEYLKTKGSIKKQLSDNKSNQNNQSESSIDSAAEKQANLALIGSNGDFSDILSINTDYQKALSEAAGMMTIVLPNILDAFLLFAIGLYIIQIFSAMVGTSIMMMWLAVPGNRSIQNIVGQLLSLMLTPALIVIGYMFGKILLNEGLNLLLTNIFGNMLTQIVSSDTVPVAEALQSIKWMMYIAASMASVCAGMVIVLPRIGLKALNAITIDQGNEMSEQAQKYSLNVDGNMRDDKTMDDINKDVVAAIEADKGQAMSMGLIDKYGNILGDGKDVVSEGNTNNAGRVKVENATDKQERL